MDTVKQNGRTILQYDLQGEKQATGQYDEIGTLGLSTFSGYVTKAYNAKLYWPSVEPLYSRIWRSDPETTIVRTLFSALTGQQSLTWELPQQIGGRQLDEPNDADKRMLEFAQTLTDDIEGGFHRWLTECNGRTSFYGFGVWEMPLGLRKQGWAPPGDDWTSKYNDRLVGIRDIAYRDYSSFHKWDLDDRTGKLSGFVQFDPPNEIRTIPIENLLHITYGDSTNPEGLATMEALWRLERVLYQYQLIHGIGSEHSAGHIKFTVQNELNETAKSTIRDAARAIMTAQEGNYGTEIEGKFTYQIVDTNFQAAPAVLEAMRYYSLLKLALYGMQFAGMNTLSDTGSYSALQDSSSMALLIFNAMAEGFVKQASDQIQRRVFMNPINKAAFAGNTRLPVLKVSKIEKVYSLPELAQFAQAIATVMPLGEDDIVAIRRKSQVLPENLPEQNATLPQGQPGQDPSAMPISTKTPGGNAPENLDSTTVLNGAQVTAVLKILDGVVSGSTPKLAAVELLIAVGMQPDRAQTIISETIKSGKVGISDPTAAGLSHPEDMDMPLWWDLRRKIYVKPRANTVELVSRLDDATSNAELMQLREDLDNE